MFEQEHVATTIELPYLAVGLGFRGDDPVAWYLPVSTFIV